MKNLKLTLSNGTELIRFSTTKKEMKEHAANIRFNPKKLDFTITEATSEEIIIEKKRRNEIENEYKNVCEQNNKVHRYNSAVAKATNHNEFMNAANQLN